MRRGSYANIIILLLCSSAVYLYTHTPPSLPHLPLPPPGTDFSDLLDDLDRTERPPRAPEQLETGIISEREEGEAETELMRGGEEGGEERDEGRGREEGNEPGWLYNNPNIEVHREVSVDGMPDYFDPHSDLLAQFEEHHQRTSALMEERLVNVREQCVRASRYLKPRSANHFLFFFPELNVTWCPVFKAGSTNWKQFFCRLYQPKVYEEYRGRADYCPLDVLMDRTERALPRDKRPEFRERTRNTVNFLTVRHPYERLVSMYTNKFEGCRTQMYSGPSGAMVQILQLYRRCDRPSLEKAELLEAARLECQKPVSERRVQPDNPYMNPMGPSFNEVVTWIVNNFHVGRFPDLHWAAMTKSCDLCITQYDVIEKFETLERDHYFLLKKLGREDQYSEIHGARGNPSSDERDTYHHVTRYLAQLDERLLWDLFAIYRDDFAMFGYTPHFRVRKNPYLETV